MSVETFSPSSSPISMTDSAIKYFESRLKNWCVIQKSITSKKALTALLSLTTLMLLTNVVVAKASALAKREK